VGGGQPRGIEARVGLVGQLVVVGHAGYYIPANFIHQTKSYNASVSLIGIILLMSLNTNAAQLVVKLVG
jgi:hypothetical protein